MELIFALILLAAFIGFVVWKIAAANKDIPGPGSNAGSTKPKFPVNDGK
jgi:hypothetical protein